MNTFTKNIKKYGKIGGSIGMTVGAIWATLKFIEVHNTEGRTTGDLATSAAVGVAVTVGYSAFCVLLSGATATVLDKTVGKKAI